MACKGHTLKIDSSKYGQAAGRGGGGGKERHNESSVAPSHSMFFLSFYGDIIQPPRPSHSAPLSMRVRWKERGCGQSVMSKKTLEDHGAVPPASWQQEADRSVSPSRRVPAQKNQKKQDTMTTRGTLNHTGISLGRFLLGTDANRSVSHLWEKCIEVKWD